MRIPLITLATVVLLVAMGVFGVPALLGNQSAELRSPVDASYRTTEVARALEPAEGTGGRQLMRRGSRIRIRHLVTKKSFEVDTNFVLRIVCPRGLDPITGGALSGPELAITNSSRVDPEEGNAQKRSWYVGMTDIDDSLGTDSFRGTIVCAKGI